MKRIRLSYAAAALAAVGGLSAVMLLTPAVDNITTPVSAQASPKCDMSQYRAVSGLSATSEQDGLAVTWTGANGSELRARYAIDNGQPVVRELAIRKSGGQWAPLGQNLVPEFYVKSGLRRMTTQQGAPLINLGVDITPEVIEKNKWYAFWDAPFVIPGVPQEQPARAGEPARGRGQPGPASQSEPAARRGNGTSRTERAGVRIAPEAGRDQNSKRHVQGRLMRREDGWQPRRSGIPRTVDGDFRGQPSLHVLSGLKFTSHGSDCENG